MNMHVPLLPNGFTRMVAPDGIPYFHTYLSGSQIGASTRRSDFHRKAIYEDKRTPTIPGYTDEENLMAGRLGTLAETAVAHLLNREWQGADWGRGDIEGGIEVKSTHRNNGHLHINERCVYPRYYVFAIVAQPADGNVNVAVMGGYKLEMPPTQLPAEWEQQKVFEDHLRYWFVPRHEMIDIEQVYDDLRKG